MLINSNNMYEYGVTSFKSVRHIFCKNIADFIFTLDVLQFFNNDEKSRVHMY